MLNIKMGGIKKVVFVMFLLAVMLAGKANAERLVGQPFLGKSTANIVMVWYGDFEDPFSRRFHSETFRLIKDQYVDSDKVLFYFKNFPLTEIHEHAQKAAEAGECAADQGYDKFWLYVDELFSNQENLEIDD